MVNANVLEQNSPERWRTLALLAVTLVLSMTTWFSASAVIPQLREAWGLSATTAAWLTTREQCTARGDFFRMDQSYPAIGLTLEQVPSNPMRDLGGGARLP